MRLVKTKSSTWAGNGCGTHAAEWTIEGHPDVRVWKAGGEWFAYKGDKKLVRFCYTRNDVLESLESIL
jgi:hypothetical protein